MAGNFGAPPHDAPSFYELLETVERHEDEIREETERRRMSGVEIFKSDSYGSPILLTTPGTLKSSDQYKSVGAIPSSSPAITTSVSGMHMLPTPLALLSTIPSQVRNIGAPQHDAPSFCEMLGSVEICEDEVSEVTESMRRYLESVETREDEIRAETERRRIMLESVEIRDDAIGEKTERSRIMRGLDLFQIDTRGSPMLLTTPGSAKRRRQHESVTTSPLPSPVSTTSVTRRRMGSTPLTPLSATQTQMRIAQPYRESSGSIPLTGKENVNAIGSLHISAQIEGNENLGNRSIAQRKRREREAAAKLSKHNASINTTRKALTETIGTLDVTQQAEQLSTTMMSSPDTLMMHTPTQVEFQYCNDTPMTTSSHRMENQMLERVYLNSAILSQNNTTGILESVEESNSTNHQTRPPLSRSNLSPGSPSMNQQPHNKTSTSVDVSIAPSKRHVGQQLRRNRERLLGIIKPSSSSKLNPAKRYSQSGPFDARLTVGSQPVHSQGSNERTLSSLVPPRNLDEEFQEVDQSNAPLQGPFLSSSSTPVSSHVLQNSSVPHNDTSNEPEHDYIEGGTDGSEDGSDDDLPTTYMSNRNANQSLLPTERHFLGMMDVPCPHCKALHWIDERLTKSSKRTPLFGTCCKEGKIRLDPLKTPPGEILALYDGNDSHSKSFLRHIRGYNNAFAFTSLGCVMDDRIIGGQGPKPFTIHGELRHRTGALLTVRKDGPIYSQLYIYDPSYALNVRQGRNSKLKREVLKIIQDTLMKSHAFVNMYKQTFDILHEADATTGNDLPAYLHCRTNADKRVYNLPTSDEIAIILPGDGSQAPTTRDVVVQYKGGNELKRINECNPGYLPLHYVLLFPRGELGWDETYTRWSTKKKCYTKKRLTMLQFYCYRIFQRTTEYSTILRARKLFQEFIVDAWAATQQNRLMWARKNQTKLRRDLYNGITDVERDTLRPDQIGQRMVLPSSFTGTPRHMYAIYQDSMAITRHNKHPDIFLTMTANPKWPEIENALLRSQTPYDLPDIVSRVFELKRKALMKQVIKKGVLGRVVAYVYTIEFQKRGLPHMHALIFLHPSDKIKSVEQVDNLISAEFPDEKTRPLLFQTVKKCMIHGPCKGDVNASCMEDGRCTKKFPREWAETTTMDKDGYPIYRRRDTGQTFEVKGKPVDNRDVVPYNPKLSEMFDCHINVEVCVGVRAVKYIHKYIYKGHDRTTLVFGALDEIKQYLDSRYVGPPEAAWRLFGYHMHQEKPSVVRLQLHLPGMHHVTFDPNESLSDIKERAKKQTSTLIQFFEYCEAHPEARKYTYQQFPEYFTWDTTTKLWAPRKEKPAIGRMYFASPNSGERFYLRLLLTAVKGPTSFENLRTVDGKVHDTFKSACVARGMLEDDEEWILCLEEAAIMNTGHQLRRLFCIILTQCSPLHPMVLWDRFKMQICDDLPHLIPKRFPSIKEPSLSQIADYGLYLLNGLLEESGKSLLDFPPMVQPVENWSVVAQNRLIFEHRQLQYEGQEVDAERDANRLNGDQRSAYNMVLASVEQSKGMTFFLNGGAGTGKTFLYNTIAKKCRSRGYIVITVASSGIASLLLVGGRTAHSTFALPLDILEDSSCGFTKQSIIAELLREAKLIIWDEVPMQHRFCVETVDRALRDVRDDPRPFGGVTVVLGGDFRQVLPVVPRGLREEIVGATLRRSTLWTHVHVLNLTENMRLRNGEAGNAQFAKFLLEVGSNPEPTVELPSTMHRCQDLNELIHTAYPGINVVGSTSPTYLNERTILSARNEDVKFINSEVLRSFPGETQVYLAADKMNDEEGMDFYPNEYLNTLDPSGLPLFKLELKIGCPIMLLRNLAPKDGLCNGTRLVVVRLASRIIEAQILSGDKAGNLVFIPRISLSPSSSELPINMSRRQFPVRLAYAMTINKAQGQSVKYVSIDLRTPVFSHGQLYVALSRCTTFNRISILLPEENTSTTANVVYPEVLL